MPMGMPTPYATRKYCTTRNKSAADASRVSFLSLVSPHVQWRCARCPRTRNIPELHPFTMPRSNDKHRIIRHYDVLSPYYRSLWGEHLHHGYWIRGDESKEKAQLQLIEHLARLAKVKPGSDILDIGCGFGASGLYLAKKHNAAVTGITISPVQAETAAKAILEWHGSTPRLYRNTLAFLAADQARFQDLDQAVRSYLAWGFSPGYISIKIYLSVAIFSD